MAKNNKLEFDAQLRPSSKKYVSKAKIVSRKCKWKNKGQNDELFMTATMSVTKFIAGSQEEAPVGFIDIQCGKFNKLKINTRDFNAFTEAIDTLHEFIHKHNESLDSTLENELSKYMEHQYAKLEFIQNLRNQNK